MARAGFDPRAALQLWEILNEVGLPSLISHRSRRSLTLHSFFRAAHKVELDVQESGDITEHIALLRTHPTGESRLVVRSFSLALAIPCFGLTFLLNISQALKALLPGAIAIYDKVKGAEKAMEAKVAQAKANQAKRDVPK